MGHRFNSKSALIALAIVGIVGLCGCAEKPDPDDGTKAPGDYRVAPGSEAGGNKIKEEATDSKEG